MTQPPLQHDLNLTTQAILTYGSYAASLVLLLIAVVKSWQQRTAFHVLLIVAAGVAALAEPLYDQGFKLLFYIPGQWTLYRYLDIPQPVWTISGYITLYAGPALFLCDAIRKGIDQRTFWLFASLTWLISSAFETFGILGGAYTYWGPHAFRIFDYPLVVGVLETTFVMLLCACASTLREHAGGWHLASLILMFPALFYAVNFGLGAPTLVTLGLSPQSSLAVSLGSAVSIAASGAVLSGIGRYVSRVESQASRAAEAHLPLGSRIAPL